MCVCVCGAKLRACLAGVAPFSSMRWGLRAAAVRASARRRQREAACTRCCCPCVCRQGEGEKGERERERRAKKLGGGREPGEKWPFGGAVGRLGKRVRVLFVACVCLCESERRGGESGASPEKREQCASCTLCVCVRACVVLCVCVCGCVGVGVHARRRRGSCAALHGGRGGWVSAACTGRTGSRCVVHTSKKSERAGPRRRGELSLIRLLRVVFFC